MEEHLRNPLLTNIHKMDFDIYKIESARNNHLNF